jgi:hypothetical protein
MGTKEKTDIQKAKTGSSPGIHHTSLTHGGGSKMKLSVAPDSNSGLEDEMAAILHKILMMTRTVNVYSVPVYFQKGITVMGSATSVSRRVINVVLL